MELIYQKDNDLFTSKVYRNGDEAIKHVWPKTEQAANCLTNEYNLIDDIESPYFVEYLWADITDHFRVATRWVDHTPITDFHKLREGLMGILPELQRVKIRHRDIWFKNILIQDNVPILIDFGWAVPLGHEDELDGVLPYSSDEKSMDILLNYVNKQCQ